MSKTACVRQREGAEIGGIRSYIIMLWFCCAIFATEKVQRNRRLMHLRKGRKPAGKERV